MTAWALLVVISLNAIVGIDWCTVVVNVSRTRRKTYQVSKSQQEALDTATDEVAKPEERALTDEQIKEKMKKFKIDDSRVKVNNNVRIRYTGGKDTKSKTDARMQTEMTFTL